MEDRTFLEWDKDDIDALGMLKVDVLALGMLTCIRKGFDLIEQPLRHARSRSRPCRARTRPSTRCCRRANSVGVFQVEVRAQMSMLPRLKPRCFYDLVIEVAIVRPGPIQGDMVHPYLRRRDGIEPVDYPIRGIEKRCSARRWACRCSRSRRCRSPSSRQASRPTRPTSCAAPWPRSGTCGTIHTFREKFIAGMVGNGYAREFAERCFSQIEGFGEYGFPESHAASFAHLVYVSSWIKRHYPDVFCAAILNSQPMGFYQPAQLVRDAREHGVEVRHPDINASDWDCTLEPLCLSPAGIPLPLVGRGLGVGGSSRRPAIAAPLTLTLSPRKRGRGDLRRAARAAAGRRAGGGGDQGDDREGARGGLCRYRLAVDEQRGAGQRAGAAGRCGRLPLHGARSARGAVGREGLDGGALQGGAKRATSANTPLIDLGGDRRPVRRGARRPARDDARRARGARLRRHLALAEGAPDRLLPRGARPPPRHHQRRSIGTTS